MYSDFLPWPVQKWPKRLICRVVDSGGPKEAQVQSYSPGGVNVPRLEAHWCHLANRPTIEPYVCGGDGDAVFCQITLITCFNNVDLCNRADHYIFALWFLSSIFYHLFSSPNLSGRRLDIYHTSTPRGPSANLECKSEMCCWRLAANTGRKKVAKNRHLGTTSTGYIFATKALIDNRKKLVKQQYLFHMSL